MKRDNAFWNALDKLVAASEVIIDRPKDTRHPKYPDMLYEVDYGYLKDTSSMDGGGIDVWRGSDPCQKFDAVMCIVDLMKRDSEIKILIGCTQDEKEKIYQMHNGSECMKGILILRSQAGEVKGL
jgi:inorganic pyrophosphatase